MLNFNDKKGFICDMDGVIYHGNRLLPGVKEFVAWLYPKTRTSCFSPTRPSIRQKSCSASWNAWVWRWMKATFTPAPWQPQNS